MGTVRNTISLTDNLQDWVRSRIALDGYADESEYIRDLIRKDREQNAGLIALRSAIDEGLRSGVSTRSVTDILNAKVAELKQDGQL